MKPSSHAVFAAAATLALWGCEESGGGETTGTRLFTDSLDILTIEHPGSATEGVAAFALEAAASVRIGAITGPETSTLSAVSSARRLSDGTFVVVDRQARAVRIYDSTGGFLRTLGGVGQGPGEYLVPELLLEDGMGRLIVYDRGGRRLVGFWSDGRVLNNPLPELPGQQSLDVAAVSLLPEGDVLWLSHLTLPPLGASRVRGEATIARLAVGVDPEVLVTFPGPEADLDVRGTPPMIAISILSHWFLPQLLAASTPHGIWTSDGGAWEIVRRRETGDVDRIVRFRRAQEPLDAQVLAVIEGSELEAAPSPEARENLRARHEATEYPEWLPAIRDLFADELGRVWLGVLEIPVIELPSRMGPAVRRWVILDQQGEEVVGALLLPPRSRPLYADEEGVLLVTADELDVPYVEWWAWDRLP